MSSSLDSGSDHSDVPMKSSVKSPSSPYRDRKATRSSRGLETTIPVPRSALLLCYFSVGKPNLEELWQEVREEGWKKRNERFRLKPRIKIVENVSTVHYDSLVFLSSAFSLFGLYCHIMFWRSDATIELHETINPRTQKSFDILSGLISIILGCNLFTSLAAAGAVALLLHAMIMMDDLPVLFIYPLAFILWVGLGMRYINM